MVGVILTFVIVWKICGAFADIAELKRRVAALEPKEEKEEKDENENPKGSD